MNVDYLIVGAGFTGSVLAERIASGLDKKVLVVEQRDHIGGNACDEYNEEGILVHRYGPHIFHTNSERVWRYLSRFTRWRPYFHKTLAVVEGRMVPIPFNLNSIYTCFPPSLAGRLERQLIEAFGYGKKIPILKLREKAGGELAFLADYIYKHVFLGYTTKQWALSPEQLDASVTGRVPVHISRDDRYSQDTFQGMPAAGYTAMFRRMLSHPNIRLLLATGYRDIIDEIRFGRMIYTGPVDQYFDCVHGELPYRSLRFEMATLDTDSHQPSGIVTYPNEYEFTRITEFKYLTGQEHRRTTIATEYPLEHVPGRTVPYYPVPHPESRERFREYKAECDALNGRVVFAGRLADYTYYNMDQAVARALTVFDRQICRSEPELAANK